MTTISTTATVGPDGMLHVPVPDATPGREYIVMVQAKPIPSANWLDNVIDVLDEDAAFERPPQGKLEPLEYLD